jgi:arsenate reductase
MTDCTVYYNPACSKCRALLALLQERGITARLVDYLQTPPPAAEFAGLVRLLGDAAAQLLRHDAAEYAELGWGEREPATDDIVAALQRFPQLLQRPVVVRGDRALIARPPERALDLF